MNNQTFSKNNKFLMLALDHRESFKKLINPFSLKLAIELKSQIIEAVYDQMTGVLVDLEYGYSAYIKLNKPQVKPFLLPLEKSGYTDQSGERITEIAHSVKELKDFGATGVKLLVYFNPSYKTAINQMQTAKKVADECKKLNMPFFLEIVNYENENDDYKVIRSLERFLKNKIYPDVFKLEYPGSLENAKKITQLLNELNIPWILLTRGSIFDNFENQLEISMQAGCSGFLAGRGLWQELPTIKDEKLKLLFLNQTLPQRFKKLVDIVNKY